MGLPLLQLLFEEPVRFSPNQLNNMTLNQANGYMKKLVGELGKGSTRKVYPLGNNYVIKVAIDQNGIQQNKDEVQTYQKCPENPLFAKINSFDQGGKWLVMQRAIPFKSEGEFLDHMQKEWGLRFEDMSQFRNLLNVAMYKAQEPPDKGLFASLFHSNTMPKWLKQTGVEKLHSKMVNNQSYKEFLKTINTCNFNPLDANWQNWGLLGNRLVLIDYASPVEQ